jgi:hypothetical protein
VTDGDIHHTGPDLPTQHRWPHAWTLSGYLLVLALIVVSYVLCATQANPNPNAFALLVQLVTVAVVLQVAQVAPGRRRAGSIVLAAAAVAVVVAQLSGAEGRVLDMLLSGASAVAYLVAPVAVISHQLRRRRVDAETLVAAIAAYILVGMFFTFVYNFVSLVTQVPTFGPGPESSLTGQLFFSFTTLTTTGYGNLVPAGAIGQSVAILEAIAGQLFLIIAVSRVVAGWERPQR